MAEKELASGYSSGFSLQLNNIIVVRRIWGNFVRKNKLCQISTTQSVALTYLPVSRKKGGGEEERNGTEKGEEVFEGSL